MKNGIPQVAIGEVLSKSEEWIDLDPAQTYQQVTIKMWGQGVVQRNEVSGAEIAASRRLKVRAGQFILSRIDARNGALGLVPETLHGAVVSNDFPAFNLNTLRIMPEYLGWMSKTHDFVELCKAASEGTTNRVRLQEDLFLTLRIPLPPLAEQRRIVARIEELAAKIEEARGLRRETVEEAEALVDAKARKMLSDTNIGATKLSCWLDQRRGGIQTGPFGAQLNSEEFVDAGIPVLTIGNVQFSGLDTSTLKYVSDIKARQLARFALKEGDILFARMGTVGRCCVVPKEAEGWLINYHIIRVALDRQKVDPRYLHWTIRASEDIETYLGEKIRGATRQGVNSEIVGSLPCRVTSLAEQHRIVAYLDSLQAKVDVLKGLQAETQSELDALLLAVLDRAFKGEL